MSNQYSGHEFVLELTRQYTDPRDHNFLNSFGTDVSSIFYTYTFQPRDITENLSNIKITFVKKVREILDNSNTNYNYDYVGYWFKIKNIQNVQNFFLKVNDYIKLSFFRLQNSTCLQNFPDPVYYVRITSSTKTIELVESNGVYTEKYCPEININQLSDLQILTDDIFPTNATIYLQIEYRNSVNNFDLFEVGFYSQAFARNKLEIEIIR
jgi:hypothetical protein